MRHQSQKNRISNSCIVYSDYFLVKKGLIWNGFLLIIKVAKYSGKKPMQKSEGWCGKKYENRYENKEKK